MQLTERDLASNFTIAAVLAAAFLACWSRGAVGADLKFPKQYIGIWCSYDNSSEIYHRRKDENACWDRGAEDLLAVKADWFGFAQRKADANPRASAKTVANFM